MPDFTSDIWVIPEESEFDSNEYHHFKDECFYPVGAMASNITKDSVSFGSGVVALSKHLISFEFFIIALTALGSTLFFYYYYDASLGYHLAARLRFTIIVTAVLLPSIVYARETTNRREDGLRKLANLKAISLSLFGAFMNWRSGIKGLTPEWENKTRETMIRLVCLIKLILSLPTIRIRHRYSRRGKLFREKILSRRDLITRGMSLIYGDLNLYVEDMKRCGLPSQEAIRLFLFIHTISRDIEGLIALKFNRTSEAARSFIRIFILTCIIFYGYVPHCSNFV